MDNKPTSFFNNVIRACRQAVFYAVIFSFFTNLFMLTIPLYMLQIYDRVFASYSYDTLLYLTILAVFALLVYALVDVARTQIFTNVSHWLDHQLGSEALLRSPDELLQGRSYGTQSIADVRNLRTFITTPGFITFFDIPWMPIYIIVIFLLNVYLGILAVFGSLMLVVLAILNQKLTQKTLMEANVKNIMSQRQIDASLRNAEVIQAMGMMPNVIRFWHKQNDEALNLQTNANRINGFLSSFSKFLRLVLQMLVFTLGAVLVIKGQLSAGSMIAASILMSRALAPVDQAIGSWKTMIASLAGYRRLKEHFKVDSLRGSAGINLPAPKGKIHIEDLVFQAAGNEKLILNRINLTIEPGELVALIGPSGAGKSTLARLIVGALKPSHGKVRLDGADVYTWDRTHFGNHVGYLPQDVELFLGTVKENIARLNEGDDAKVISAAKLADIHDLILHFPKGYDTPTVIGGFNISNGQRQRIALARALYDEPAVLVLDEPNSNLDQKGEEALLQALLTMKQKGATQLVITHRPYLLNSVDKIILLREGMVQLFGTRDEVLKALQTPPR